MVFRGDFFEFFAFGLRFVFLILVLLTSALGRIGGIARSRVGQRPHFQIALRGTRQRGRRRFAHGGRFCCWLSNRTFGISSNLVAGALVQEFCRRRTSVSNVDSVEVIILQEVCPVRIKICGRRTYGCGKIYCKGKVNENSIPKFHSPIAMFINFPLLYVVSPKAAHELAT